MAQPWGVGARTHERLRALGLETIDDLARRDREALLAREEATGALVPMRLAAVSAVRLEAPTVQPGRFDGGGRRAARLNGALDTDRGTLRDGRSEQANTGVRIR